MNARCIALAVSALGVYACGQFPQAQPAGMPAPDSVQAIIGESAARFVFPAEAAPKLTWDDPNLGAYPGRPEFTWEVRWDIKAPGQPGVAPHGLALVTEWRTGGPHYGHIGELIAAFAPRVVR